MTAPAFLNVETSITGRRWIGPGPMEDRASEALVQSSGVSLPVARVLARNAIGQEDVASYLDPKLRDLMPDPRTLKDMEIAAGRLNSAVEKGHRIAIFADYDVDGGSSAALLIRWLRVLGHVPTLYVPDRMREGYGPNVPAMEQLASDHELIICVDCGTLSHEPIAAAKGTDVIVLDHHLGGTTLPPALAVVNPNRQDETSDQGALCAAGVVFMVLVDANRQRRDKGQATPDLIGLLDLVALATVADVAPLTGLNRAFVRQGLAVMARRERPGLVALLDLTKLDSAPAPYHLGFVLGPRINAGGRIGKADLGARLLATDDPHEAAAIAERLDMLNKERRDIENRVRDAALEQIEQRAELGPLAWAAGAGWHAGVLGIVASRIKEATGLPSVVIGIDGDEAKGSGRSVSGVDLGTAIQRIADEGLIERGGGHAMAAGLSLLPDQIEPAMDRLADLLARQGAGSGGPREMRIDGMLMTSGATVDLVNDLEKAGPFGASNPAPRFVFPDQMIKHARRVGESHLKITFADPAAQARGIDAIAFGAFDGPLGPALDTPGSARFHLAGRLEINNWQGRQSPQLRLEDAFQVT